MVDNIILSQGSEDGPVIATDDITDVHYPISKLAHGALDSATLVSSASGLPVSQQGTWNVNLGATDNQVLDDIATDAAAIEVLLTTLNSLITTIDGVLDAIDAGKLEEATFTGRIGEVQDSPTQFTVLERLKVIATALAGTLTVSGTVTANLGATDNGVLDAIQAAVEAIETAVEGTLAVNVGLTDTELRATAVPVSVSGVATDAKLDTIIGHVDGLEALIGTTNTNTAASTTALQIIDDWDESDRAKVNPIVGQAGVAAGEGAVGATVQRTTEAGHTPFYNLDVDESEDAIKATAGTLQGFVAINGTAAPLYLKFYNATTANVSVGTTAPHITFKVPANADSDGAGFVWNKPILFGTAITIACTTAAADADTGAPGAGDMIVSGVYD